MISWSRDLNQRRTNFEEHGLKTSLFQQNNDLPKLKLQEKGYLRFKCCGERDFYCCSQGVSIKKDKVFLPKIGLVRFKKSREIECIIKQTTVTNECGKWYVCFFCEIEVEDKPWPCPLICATTN